MADTAHRSMKTCILRFRLPVATKYSMAYFTVSVAETEAVVEIGFRLTLSLLCCACDLVVGQKATAKIVKVKYLQTVPFMSRK